MYYNNESAWPIGTNFMMANTMALDNWGMTPELPTPMRLFFLATARVNKIGHAEFNPGELTMLLGKPDEDGRLVPMSRQNVNKAIKTLIDTGVILEGSEIRCIMIGEYAIRRDGKGSTDSCHWHAINTDKRRVRRTKEEGVVEVTPRRAVEVRKAVEETPSEVPVKPSQIDSEPLLEPEPVPVLPELEETVEEVVELHPVLEMVKDLYSGKVPTDSRFWDAFNQLQDYEQAELHRSLVKSEPTYLQYKLIKLFEELDGPEEVVEEEEPRKKPKCGTPTPGGPCRLDLDHNSDAHFDGTSWYLEPAMA